MAVEIVDLSKQTFGAYLVCLEDWSDELPEAGDHKAMWFERMKDLGLLVKLAVENGKPVGMIQYAPIAHATAEGRDLHFIYCIWVHGHKGKGVGNAQKRGAGKALLQAAEDDARSLGSRGMAAWGLSLPFWMRASWYKKQGYRKADRDGIAVLLWKPFSDDAEPPRWIRQKKTPGKISGKVAVTAFCSGWCTAQNLVVERARRAAAEFGGAAEFRFVDTFDRETFREWGISDGLFIDGKQVRTGPPPAYEKIRRKIGKRIKRT